MSQEKSNNQNLFIGAIAIIGLLTLVNSYKIFFGTNTSRVVPTVNNQLSTVPTANNNQGPNFPSTVPNQNTPAAPTTPTGIASVDKSLATTNIKFDNNNYSFGEILQNSTNNYSYTFRNTGTDPLIISDAKGTCGCTKPSFPKEPIMPGETGKIDIVYSPGTQSGNQTKAVKIYANTTPAEIELKFTANVKPDPNAPKPEVGGANPGMSPQPINVSPVAQ